MITLNHYLIVAALLFCIGIYGVIKRRNLLMIFFSGEIMLNAANIGFVSVSSYYGDISGMTMALFVVGVAAAGVALAIGFMIAIYRQRGTIELDSIKSMKE